VGYGKTLPGRFAGLGWVAAREGSSSEHLCVLVSGARGFARLAPSEISTRQPRDDFCARVREGGAGAGDSRLIGTDFEKMRDPCQSLG